MRSSAGIWPVSRLESNNKRCRFDSVDSPLGRLPVSALARISRMRSVVMRDRDAGTLPYKPVLLVSSKELR